MGEISADALLGAGVVIITFVGTWMIRSNSLLRAKVDQLVLKMAELVATDGHQTEAALRANEAATAAHRRLDNMEQRLTRAETRLEDKG